MKNRLNNHLKEIQISGIRKFNQLANNYKDVIKLTLGQPNFHVHDEIKRATKDAVDNNLTTYTPNQGISQLRIKIASYLESKVDHSINSENIIVTIGSAGGLSVALNSILNPDDEVILLTPGYPGYEPLLKLNNCHAKYVEALSSVNKEEIEKSITKNTKAIIITSPNNPTGHVYSQEDFDILFDAAKNHQLFIIWDAIYLDLVYEQAKPIYIPKELNDNLIIIGGFSKSHSMTGYRLGFLASSQEITKELLKTQQYSVTSASSICQYAALEALTVDNNYMVEEYQSRRDYLMKSFDELDVDYLEPKGAFYLFLDISKFNISGEKFAIKLLDKVKVACVPGKYFTGNYDNYIRISYATDMSQLEEAIKRIKQFLDNKDWM